MTFRVNKATFLVIITIYLFVFQSPLSDLFALVGYVDELFAVIFVPMLIIYCINMGYIKVKKSNLLMVFFLLAFIMTGISADILYKYQPVNLVVVDILTNLKFYLSLGTGILFCTLYGSEVNKKQLLKHVKLISIIIGFIFVLDRMFNIWNAEIRYGIKVAKLIWFHPTYLAASVIFLIACLIALYENKNVLYIIMDVIVLVFTFRSKAIAAALICAVLVFYKIYLKGKIKLYHIILLGAAALIAGWNNVKFYYIQLNGLSARSILTKTAIQIMKDYFPIGTGFATYASHSAAVNYSPVYEMYGFRNYYELKGGEGSFLDDTFWPIIIGQTGFIGTLAYIAVLILLFYSIWNMQKTNRYYFVAGIFIFIYVIISSTSEPAFNNSVSIPLAALLGYLISKNRIYNKISERHRIREDSCESSTY